jgi:hypothetical protein
MEYKSSQEVEEETLQENRQTTTPFTTVIFVTVREEWKEWSYSSIFQQQLVIASLCSSGLRILLLASIRSTL